MLRILYRISDAGNPKDKIEHAGKIHCLENCIKEFGKEGIILFADHCNSDTLYQIKNLGLEVVESSVGNALGWRNVAHYAIEKFDSEDIVYFLEEDYLHLPNSRKLLLEGVEMADYVTLYDHPDKFLNDGPNPYVVGGGETMKLLVSKSSHWKTTNSTTMTFAVKVKTLKEDKDIWWQFTDNGFPNDFGAFQALCGFGNWTNRIFGKRRTLISSVPGLSTHIESAWLSPFTDWSKV